MSQTRPIVVIVPDPALSRSLAFALEADGYRVAAFDDFTSAKGALPSALCIVADQSVFHDEAEAASALSGLTARTVLISEHMAKPLAENMPVLTKPLSGADVLSAVGKFLPGQPHYV